MATRAVNWEFRQCIEVFLFADDDDVQQKALNIRSRAGGLLFVFLHLIDFITSFCCKWFTAADANMSDPDYVVVVANAVIVCCYKAKNLLDNGRNPV